MNHFDRLSLFERLVTAPRGEPWGDGCWHWTGSCCNKGYGHIKVNGITKRVHIVAWELVKGRKVRRGYTLDHGCRNKACWRPSHMTEMTRAKNTAKGNRDNPRSTVAANAARKERCRCGHAKRPDMPRCLNCIECGRNKTVTPITDGERRGA